jgi:hypothetical protein
MPDELSELAASVASGRAEPEAALRTALTLLNARSEKYYYAFQLDSSDIEPRLNFPEFLLMLEKLEGFVVATHVKVANDPWAQPIAFIFYAGERTELEAGVRSETVLTARR